MTTLTIIAALTLAVTLTILTALAIVAALALAVTLTILTALAIVAALALSVALTILTALAIVAALALAVTLTILTALAIVTTLALAVTLTILATLTIIAALALTRHILAVSGARLTALALTLAALLRTTLRRALLGRRRLLLLRRCMGRFYGRSILRSGGRRYVFHYGRIRYVYVFVFLLLRCGIHTLRLGRRGVHHLHAGRGGWRRERTDGRTRRLLLSGSAIVVTIVISTIAVARSSALSLRTPLLRCVPARALVSGILLVVDNDDRLFLFRSGLCIATLRRRSPVCIACLRCGLLCGCLGLFRCRLIFGRRLRGCLSRCLLALLLSLGCYRSLYGSLRLFLSLLIVGLRCFLCGIALLCIVSLLLSLRILRALRLLRSAAAKCSPYHLLFGRVKSARCSLALNSLSCKELQQLFIFDL